MEIRFTMLCRYFVARIDNRNCSVRPSHIGADVCPRPKISVQIGFRTQLAATLSPGPANSTSLQPVRRGLGRHISPNNNAELPIILHN